jgi:hypothetical protein
MVVKVAVQPNGYNEVKGYKPVQQATTVAPTPAQGSVTTPVANQRPAPAASATAPWKRSA